MDLLFITWLRKPFAFNLEAQHIYFTDLASHLGLSHDDDDDNYDDDTGDDNDDDNDNNAAADDDDEDDGDNNNDEDDDDNQEEEEEDYDADEDAKNEFRLFNDNFDFYFTNRLR